MVSSFPAPACLPHPPLLGLALCLEGPFTGHRKGLSGEQVGTELAPRWAFQWHGWEGEADAFIYSQFLVHWVQGAWPVSLDFISSLGVKVTPPPTCSQGPSVQDEEVRSRGEENLCFGSTASRLWTLVCLLPSGPQMAGAPSLSPGSHPTVGGLSNAGVLDRQPGQGVACWNCILPV